MNNNYSENGERIRNLEKEAEEKNKIIWTSMWIMTSSSLAALLFVIMIAGYFIPEGTVQTMIILAAVIVFLIPCFYALKLEISVGAYECQNCGHKIVPGYKEALMAMHIGVTRYLRCPQCHKRTWCKKIVNPKKE